VLFNHRNINRMLEALLMEPFIFRDLALNSDNLKQLWPIEDWGYTFNTQQAKCIILTEKRSGDYNNVWHQRPAGSDMDDRRRFHHCFHFGIWNWRKWCCKFIWNVCWFTCAHSSTGIHTCMYIWDTRCCATGYVCNAVDPYFYLFLFGQCIATRTSSWLLGMCGTLWQLKGQLHSIHLMKSIVVFLANSYNVFLAGRNQEEWNTYI